MGAGPATAPGGRRGSSTAVSSEVKVRARRAQRVHTNTHTRARRPLITHTTHPTPPHPRALRMRDHTPPPLRSPSRSHPCTPATDHEAPRLPDAWMSAAGEGRPSPARGGLPLRDTPPRRAVPAASRESPPGAEHLGCCASPPSRVSRLRVSLQASPRPPGPMTAAAAQRQADYNKKQSFPLSPPTARPPPPSPSLPVLCKTSRHRRSDSRYQTSPREPRPVPPGGPLSASSRAPASGVSFSPPPHPQPPRYPQPGAGRKKKTITTGPNFMVATGMGWGKPGKGWGARTPSAGIFGGGSSQQRPPRRSPSPSHQLSRLPPPRHIRAPSPVTRVSPVGLPGAARARDATSPSLPPASPSAHPGRAPQGGPRRPETAFPPPSCRAFPPGGSAGSETRKVLSPAACPRAPQTPKPLAGNRQETPRCGRRWGAAGGQQQHSGHPRPEDRGTPGTGAGA